MNYSSFSELPIHYINMLIDAMSFSQLERYTKDITEKAGRYVDLFEAWKAHKKIIGYCKDSDSYIYHMDTYIKGVLNLLIYHGFGNEAEDIINLGTFILEEDINEVI